MFYVMVNAYSHEGSGAAERHSGHETKKQAKTASDAAWLSDKHRFVYVEDAKRKQVYAPFNQNYAWEELHELLTMHTFGDNRVAIKQALKLTGQLHVAANTNGWPIPKQLRVMSPRAYWLVIDALYTKLEGMKPDG